ncbi:2-dehydro-3-deoxy-6-phosphogalactonate aldolase [Shimia biformata]|uniref:2-dehydro-3-deoxy-6-phosphogalactonate aldolase n=1 Tax=Shimia biformata TaxID=1294299 RepID=UPI00194DD0B3|nr:2-dehydro-3-deoxy-6-phosphogalactonate aldolase [Shimia biformata]
MSREIIAILRGVRPDEVLEIGSALVETGIDQIEVPMNSPDPLRSVGILANGLGGRAQIGAGTVLTADDVAPVHDVGGTLIVSPDCNPDVITRTKALGMTSYPGVLTPSECFLALRHGADGLKFFPGSLLGPEGLKALRAVLPAGTRTYAVGGAGPENFADWFAAGVTGFGIGSALYKPGMSPDDVARRAAEIVTTYEAVKLS